MTYRNAVDGIEFVRACGSFAFGRFQFPFLADDCYIRRSLIPAGTPLPLVWYRERIAE